MTSILEAASWQVIFNWIASTVRQIQQVLPNMAVDKAHLML